MFEDTIPIRYDGLHFTRKERDKDDILLNYSITIIYYDI